MMPKTTMELLNSWTRIGNRGKVKIGERLFQPVMVDSMVRKDARYFEGQNDSFQKIKMKSSSLLLFGVSKSC